MSNFRIIGDAIDWEVRNWQERQIDALREEAFPLIDSKDSELLKTFTALNSAWGASKVFLTPLKEMAKPATIPLFVLDKVQDRMTQHYKDYIGRVNNRMSIRFTDVRDRLINEIQAVSRSFKGTPEGIKLTKILDTGISCPIKINSPEKVEVFYREVLHQTGAIPTNPSVIRKQTKLGFTKLLANVKEIYLGSYHGPCWGNDQRGIYYSDSGAELPIAHGRSDYFRLDKDKELKARGAKFTYRGYVYFEGFSSLRTDKCFNHEHQKDSRQVQDQILSQVWKMEVKVRRGISNMGSRNYDVYVSHKYQSKTFQPPVFQPPNMFVLKNAYDKAMTELKSRQVI